jgi:vitamin B12 transporter
LHKTGKNVQLITSKDLEKYKGQNLSEVLSQVSGFQITGNFNNNTEPKSMKIRGGKMANVLVLVDGIPLKDVTGNDYNAVDLRLFASENIESIEILSGASSVLYGSNATVSVINIKTKNSQKT